MKWSRISTAITVLAVIAAWETGHYVQIAGGRFPSLSSVALVFTSEDELRQLALSTARTLTLVLEALAIGGFTGYGLGLLIGISFPYLTGPYNVLNAVKSTPVTVLIPVFLSLFGLGQFLLPLLLLPVIAIMGSNVAQSVVHTNNNRKAILELYGVRNLSYFRRVLLHELAEPVYSTLRIIVPFAVALEVAIDYFLNINKGLGTFISQAYQAPNRDSQMYAGIIVVSIIGVGSVMLIDGRARRTLIWKRET